MSIATRLSAVRGRIAAAVERAGRTPDDVKLIVVTKTHSVDCIREVVAAGAARLGENRLEEAEPKIAALCNLQAEWHMIGHLQSRKAKRVGTLFALIHSVDRVRTLEALAAGRPAAAPPQDILLEVNVAGELGKHGVAPADLPALYSAAAGEASVRVRGLMTMAPFVDDPAEARPVFRRLRELRDELVDGGADPAGLAELSMGMTNDFEVAIEEGATLVRIGTAIMGPRET